MLKDTTKSYGTVTRHFHWIMAFLMVGMILVGFLFSNHIIEGPDNRALTYMWHKDIGLTILWLTVLRIIWRLNQDTPSLNMIPAWQRFAAQLNIKFLYLSMIAFPLSGFGMSWFNGRTITYFNFVEFPTLAEKYPAAAGFLHTTHSIFAYAIVISLIAHIAAALYHHFVLKDTVFHRMWRG